MPATRTCPQCGATLPDQGWEGLCPKCLVRVSLEAVVASDAGKEALRPEQAETPPKPDLMNERVGTTIGNYKLVQQIGEGGFGVIFMAEQIEPVQRRVALKIIKAGMDTREVIARFEVERQALALMDHPNIARVFDGGTTTNSRPYFVMELVKGIPLTNYCDQANLSTRERLELFLDVCRAVQHAHQKGIIHRDLKPGNVLVTLHDGEPVPKVIDFGVAKALGQKLTEKTLFTRFEQMVGTPAYMSPEQAALSGLDVDTRSDIYALGVLLYELLTGVTPLDAETLRHAALDEIRRMIRETDPPKPSTRLLTLGGRLAEVARKRQTEPTTLNRLIRGDLDWITMKALEKDRRRRYDTVNGLAMDIERHHRDEPVVARPPSKLYRLEKLARRNKLAFSSGAIVAMALSAGAAIGTWQAIRATRAEQEQARLYKQSAANQKKAETEAFRSQQVARLLTEMLKGVGPSVARGRDTTMLQEILDKTAERLGKELTNQPEVEAELRSTIGGVYYDLGKHSEAEKMVRQALAIRTMTTGSDSAAVGSSLNDLARIFQVQGKLGEAEGLFRQALEIRRKQLGNEHPDVARTLTYLSLLLIWYDKKGEGEIMGREALALKRKVFGSESLEVANSLTYLAPVVSDHDPPEAEAMLHEALAIFRNLGEDASITYGYALYNLSRVLSAEQKVSEAVVARREALTLWRKQFGNEHPNVIFALNGLAELLRDDNKLVEAEAALRELLAICIKRSGKESDDVAQALFALGDILVRQGKLLEAHSVFAEADQAFEQAIKPGAESQPGSESLLRERATFYARRGHWSRAVADTAKVLELQPEDHRAYHTLAPLLVANGETDKYCQHRTKLLAQFGGAKDLTVAERTAKSCLILPCSGAELEKAPELAERAVQAPTNHGYIAWFRFVKGLAEYRQGHFESAVDWMAAVLVDTGEKGTRGLELQAVLAMSQYRLHHTDAAREALEKAGRIEQKLPHVDRGDLGDIWSDWIIGHTLLKEAKELIESGVTDGREAAKE